MLARRRGKSSIPEAEIIDLPPDKDKKSSNKRKFGESDEIMIHQEVGEFTLRKKSTPKNYMRANLDEEEEEEESDNLESEEEVIYTPTR